MVVDIVDHLLYHLCNVVDRYTRVLLRYKYAVHCCPRLYTPFMFVCA